MTIRRGRHVRLVAVVGVLLAGGFAAAGSVPAVAGPLDPACDLLEQTSRGTRPVVKAVCPPLTEEWVARRDGQGNTQDEATAVAVNSDGSRVFVTGESRWGTGVKTLDYETVAYDTESGKETWAARYNGPANERDVATAIVVSPDSSTVFVTGKSHNSGSSYDYDYVTIAYDAESGAQVWAARHDLTSGSYSDTPSINVSPDGSTVFVAGYRATVVYDAESGEQVWDARASNTIEMAMSPDGSAVFVLGSSSGVVGYDAESGVRRWSAPRYRPEPDRTCPDGYRCYSGGSPQAFGASGSTVFVSGYYYWTEYRSNPYTSNRTYGFATVAYDAETGEQVWANEYEGGSDSHQVRDLAVSPDSSAVFVTGYKSNYNPGSYGSDFVTVAYDAASGTESWDAGYTSPTVESSYGYSYSYDQPTKIAASPDSSAVFVTGYSTGYPYPNYNAATVAYDAACGARLGVGRYDGPGSSTDHGEAVAVSPSGSAFVAGYAAGPGTGNDYVTIAYSLPTDNLADQPVSANCPVSAAGGEEPGAPDVPVP